MCDKVARKNKTKYPSEKQNRNFSNNQFSLFQCKLIRSFLFHSSDENTAVNHAGVMSVSQLASAVGEGGEGWRRPRSESSADAESVYMTNAVLSDSGYAQASRRSSVSELLVVYSWWTQFPHSLLSPFIRCRWRLASPPRAQAALRSGV